MVVNWAKLKKSTIALLALVATGTLTVQQEWVKDHVIPLLANHPHLSTLGSGLLLILSLLHSPQALKIIQSLSASETTETPSGDIKTTEVTVQTTKPTE
jgi:hypothetical protein